MIGFSGRIFVAWELLKFVSGVTLLRIEASSPNLLCCYSISANVNCLSIFCPAYGAICLFTFCPEDSLSRLRSSSTLSIASLLALISPTSFLIFLISSRNCLTISYSSLSNLWLWSLCSKSMIWFSWMVFLAALLLFLIPIISFSKFFILFNTALLSSASSLTLRTLRNFYTIYFSTVALECSISWVDDSDRPIPPDFVLLLSGWWTSFCF